MSAGRVALARRCPAVVAVAVAAVLCGSAAGSPADAADGEVTVEVVTSTEGRTERVEEEQRSVVPGEGTGPQVRVDPAGARQRIHGVGAAVTESSAYLLMQLPPAERRALLEDLYDPDRGGHSVVRVPIGASDFVLETHSLADSPVPDPDLTTFTIDRDRQWVIPVLREILEINPDIEILASPWSAPGWMKNLGRYQWFGVLLEEYESAYADYLVRFLDAYRDEGITVDWLTVQNEPAAAFLDTPSMIMSSAQQARLVRDHLGPALVAADLDTRVLAWDHNWCDARPPGGCVGSEPTRFPLEVIEATGGAHPLAGTAFHCYGGNQAAANDLVHQSRPDLQIWLTECSGGTWQGDPFANTARLLITDRNHWSSATILWNLALDPDNGPTTGCTTCRGVVTIDPATDTWIPELERDVLATMAWFGGRDSGVLETTATDTLLATGVCSPDRRPAAIIWNPGGETTASVHFGDVALPIDLAARSLTAIRAPEGVDCELANWPAPSEPPPPVTPPTTPPTSPPSTSSTTSSTTVSRAAVSTTPATPVAASPRLTG